MYGGQDGGYGYIVGCGNDDVTVRLGDDLHLKNALI